MDKDIETHLLFKHKHHILEATSVGRKVEKISHDHASIIHATSKTHLTQRIASSVDECEDGRVMVMVGANTQPEVARDEASRLSREIACFNSAQDLVHKFNSKDKNKLDFFVAVRTFYAPEGKFETVVMGSGKGLIMVYDPTRRSLDKRFRTLKPYHKDFGIMQDSLPEESILLCLGGEILDDLPKASVKGWTEGNEEIDFAALRTDPDFKLPEEITEKSLTVAFVNYAAKKKRDQNPDLSSTAKVFEGHDFFIAGLTLSNDLKTKTWLNPANVTPWLIIAMGIALGLNFFAPEWFLAAAPYLSAIVLGGAALAGIALVAYAVVTSITDIQNQWKSRKVERFEPTTENEKKWNYITGIMGRVAQWCAKHPVQLVVGIVAAVLMFTMVGLVLWWMMNPLGMDATIAGHVLKLIFDAIANTFIVEFKVGSVVSNLWVMVVSAFSGVVMLDGIRRLGAWGYENFASEKTPELDLLMSEDSARERSIEEKKSNQEEFNKVFQPSDSPYATSDRFVYIGSNNYYYHDLDNKTDEAKYGCSGVFRILRMQKGQENKHNPWWLAEKINHRGETVQRVLICQSIFTGDCGISWSACRVAKADEALESTTIAKGEYYVKVADEVFSIAEDGKIPGLDEDVSSPPKPRQPFPHYDF